MFQTGRGYGSCPNCHAPYGNRYKPKNCASCSFEIGGSFVPSESTKVVVPESTIILSLSLHGTNVFSVKTSTRNHRCFVVNNGDSTMCHHSNCKEKRSVFVYSGCEKEFTCEHIEKVKSASEPLWSTSCRTENVETYVTDDNVKSVILETISEHSNLPHVVCISQDSFAVYSIPTASNPIGYVHVKKDGDVYRCSSKDCKSLSSVRMKQVFSRNICVHIHILLCCSQFNQPSKDGQEGGSLTEAEPTNTTEHNSTATTSRTNTLLLYKDLQLPYKIPEVALQKCNHLDSLTLLSDQHGWPIVMEPDANCCSLCDSALCPSRCHPGSNGHAILFTANNPFRKLKVMVKMCSNSDCQAMHRVIPTENGKYTLTVKFINDACNYIQIRN